MTFQVIGYRATEFTKSCFYISLIALTFLRNAAKYLDPTFAPMHFFRLATLNYYDRKYLICPLNTTSGKQMQSCSLPQSTFNAICCTHGRHGQVIPQLRAHYGSLKARQPV